MWEYVGLKFLIVYSTRSQVKQEHFGGLIFLVLTIVAEKFDVKVSFRLEFSYIVLSGGGRMTALIRCRFIVAKNGYCGCPRDGIQ